MKLFATLLVAFVARASADEEQFVPTTRGQLQSAAMLYCAGLWPDTEESDPKNWNIEAVTDLNHLFANYSDCNPDVSNWNVSSVDSLVGMFENATGFDQDISNWQLKPSANTTDIFARACPANSTTIQVQSVVDSATISRSESSLRNVLMPSAFDAPIGSEVVIELGEIAKRCACDGDLGFNSDSECVVCADIDMVKNEEGVCETTCPTGAEKDGDSCYCTSYYEEYDEDENKCVCSKGAYGDGNGTCEQCPDHTKKKYGVYAGVGDIEDRCECEEYYEVWDSDEEMCVCKKGAYGDGDGDCEKCPDGMEADEDEPGTGDKEDRCKCTHSDWTKWDDDEEKCLCKEGAYMWKDECYECEKDMEAKETGLGDGDIQDRCQCEDDEYIIPDGKYECKYDCPNDNEEDTGNASCGCKKGYWGFEDECEECPPGMKAIDSSIEYGNVLDRCECTDPDKTEFVDKDLGCECKEGFYQWKKYCYPCDGYDFAKAKAGKGVGNGDFADRCECTDNALVIDIEEWDCVVPP